MPRKKLSSVLIKPAGPDCNMACAYCFYSAKAALFGDAPRHRMSLETLEELIRQVMSQSGEEVSLGWQGGEPTLMGLDFFQKAVDLEQEHGQGQTVGNGLQTNGLLLDSAWASFLRRYNFLVGLSIDGPEHVHNHYRRLAGGGPSWAKVSDRAKLLLDAGVAVNALAVVNDYSAGHAAETYDYFKSTGLEHMQFIPCVETAPNGHAAPFSVSGQAYGQFLCTIYDLWRADFRNGFATTTVRFFDSVFYTYLDMEAPECLFHKECGPYVVVEHNGDVYSCDFFVEPRWRLGNIAQGRLSDMLNSGLQTSFGRQKAELPDQCRKCRWLKYCRGGCLKDRLRDPADGGLNHFCAAMKIFFEHADADLRDLAAQWRARQAAEAGARQAQDTQAKVGRNDPCPCGSGKKFKKCCGR